MKITNVNIMKYNKKSRKWDFLRIPSAPFLLFPSNPSFLKPTCFYSWHHYFLSLKFKTSKVTLDSSSLGGSVVNHLSAMQETQETWVGSLGRKDPLEEETATHSSILAWEIPGQGSLAGWSPRGHKRVGHDLATKQ